ncbi:hypothetical protein KSF73_14580 [Burkholderiaceae bacterium DAT-1]|nr:hypothetical protein [Burkholderiaceae bacterium DAT-1]
MLAAAANASTATEKAACTRAAGSFMIGKVLSGPSYVSGKYLDGVQLSHTHIQLQNEADQKVYDIAIDNVFASGYDNAGYNVPAPLNKLVYGTRVELCGLPFSGGMHWVHTNCGVTPTKSKPDGWVKILDSKGNPGSNLENREEYCYLWN